MANKNLFQSIVGKLLPKTDAINEERAPAYALTTRRFTLYRRLSSLRRLDE